MSHALIVLAIFFIIFNATGVWNAYYEDQRRRSSRREIVSKVPMEIAALKSRSSRKESTTDEDVLYFRELNRSSKIDELILKDSSKYSGLADLAEIVAESGTPLHPKMPTTHSPEDS